jgi:hypothetical protein
MKNIIMLAALLPLMCMILAGTTMADALDKQQTVMATGTVPDELSFSLSEESGGSDLGDIYPGPGHFEGSASILSTGLWSLVASDGTLLGDGFMKATGRPSPKAHFQIRTNTLWKNLPKFGYPTLMKTAAPGRYDFTTRYQQSFTDGDYAGTYHITVLWLCSAEF